MKQRFGVPMVGLLAAAGIAVALLSACGVPQKDVDALKQQLAAKEQEAAQAKQELDTLKKNNVLSIIPDAPPRKPAPTPAPGAPPPPPPPTPPEIAAVPVFMYVDTVTAGAGESKYNVDGSRYCVITGAFKRGMHIVWRMRAVDTSTGKMLQAADVKSAVLKLPKGDTLNFRYGRHGTVQDPLYWFWTTAWDVPPDYPLGVLDFTIEVTTKDGKAGTFRQLQTAAPERGIESRLNIVE